MFKTETRHKPADVTTKPAAKANSYDLVTTEAEFDKLQKPWNRLAIENELHIFQTFEWNRIWWKHFGSRGQLRIFVLYEGSTVTAIAPLFLDHFYLLGKPAYSSLRMIGSWTFRTSNGSLLGKKAYSDYLQFLIAPGYESAFYSRLMAYFRDVSSADELRIDEMPETGECYQHFMAFLESSEHHFIQEDDSSSPVMLPEKDWQTYLKTRKPKERNNIKRHFKKGVHGDKQRFQLQSLKQNESAEPVIKNFIELHQQQWISRGMPGTFAEQTMYDFFTDVTPHLHRKGWIEIHWAEPLQQLPGNEPVAYNIILSFRNKKYLFQRAMDTQSDIFKQAPGNALLMANLRQAIKEQNIFDFLRDEHEYKIRLSHQVFQNKRIQIHNDTPLRTTRRHIAYYIASLTRRIHLERIRRKHILNQSGFPQNFLQYLRHLQRRLKSTKSENV